MNNTNLKPTLTNINFDKWFDKFKPLINPENNGSGLSEDDDFYMYETYGNDYLKVRHVAMSDEKTHVWTLDEIDSELILINGFHESPSTFGYFITYEPAECDYKINYI